jgi:hypothetical protein
MRKFAVQKNKLDPAERILGKTKSSFPPTYFLNGTGKSADIVLYVKHCNTINKFIFLGVRSGMESSKARPPLNCSSLVVHYSRNTYSLSKNNYSKVKIFLILTQRNVDGGGGGGGVMGERPHTKDN